MDRRASLACGLVGLAALAAGCGERLQRVPIDLPVAVATGRISAADWAVGDGLWLRTDPGCHAAAIAELWMAPGDRSRTVGAGVHAMASGEAQRLRIGSDGQLITSTIASDRDVEVVLEAGQRASDVSIAVPGTCAAGTPPPFLWIRRAWLLEVVER